MQTSREQEKIEIFAYYLVGGEKLPRRPYNGKGNSKCSICKAKPGEWHKYLCKKELSVCHNPQHKYMIDCDCEIREGEEV